jgi:hypothetical protein
LLKICPNGAAKTAICKQGNRLSHLTDQIVVNANGAQLVDHDGYPVHRWMPEQTRHQRCFASTEKTRNHSDWDFACKRILVGRRLNRKL